MNRSHFRRAHAVLGVSISLFVVYLAITGIFLNHPNLVSDASPVVQEVATVDGAIRFMAQDPYRPLMVWGTQEGVYVSASAQGPFRMLALRYPAKQVVDVLFGPQDRYLVFRRGVVLRSKDARVWDRVSVPDTLLGIRSAALWQDGTLVLVGDNGVYQRHPNTLVWEQTQTWKRSVKEGIYQLHTGHLVSSWFVYFLDCDVLWTLVMM